MKFSDDQKKILTELYWNPVGMLWQTVNEKTGEWDRRFPLHAVESLIDYGIIRSVYNNDQGTSINIRFTRKGWDMSDEIKKGINFKHGVRQCES